MNLQRPSPTSQEQKEKLTGLWFGLLALIAPVVPALLLRHLSLRDLLTTVIVVYALGAGLILFRTAQADTADDSSQASSLPQALLRYTGLFLLPVVVVAGIAFALTYSVLSNSRF